MRFLLTPSYAKSATPLQAAATSDTVPYKITVLNTGLLEVFDISVTAWGDGAGISGGLTCTDVDETQHLAGDAIESGLFPTSYESLEIQGLARYPGSGLRGGSSLTCTFSSAVGQTEVSSERRCHQQQIVGTNVYLFFCTYVCRGGRSWIRQTYFLTV